jgi:peptide/nickel transport system permease protein
MLTLIGRRLAAAIPSVIGVVVVTFVLTRALPGDPAAYFAGPNADAKAIAEIRAALGLDRSLPEQFVRYVGDLLRGDLGQSLSTGRPVLVELASRLPASLELTLLGLVISLAIALPLGILAATRPNSWVDHLCRVIVTLGVSMPTFFTGLVLVYVFYFLLGWSPAPLGRLDAFFSSPPDRSGLYLVDSLLAGDGETFLAAAAQLILPAATLAIFTLAPLARMTRASMLAVLSADFMLPVVTTLGMVFSFLLGANVLVEKVFAWPGIGSYAIEALIAADYAPIQGFVLTMALLYVLLNLAIDLLYGVIDPRLEPAA